MNIIREEESEESGRCGEEVLISISGSEEQLDLLTASMICAPARQNRRELWGELWLFSTCTGPKMASSTHASSKRSCAKTMNCKWIPRRKEISPRYLERHQHATSCNCFAMQAAQRFFVLQGVGRLLRGLVGEICGPRSAPNMGKRSRGSVWDRDELVSSLVCSPCPDFRDGSQGLNIPILTPTAGNMAWFIRVTWVAGPLCRLDSSEGSGVRSDVVTQPSGFDINLPPQLAVVSGQSLSQGLSPSRLDTEKCPSGVKKFSLQGY
jgi:hypothetical protein